VWEGEGGGRGEEGMVMAVGVVVVVGLRRVVHHHCRLRLERRRCDASRRVGHRRGVCLRGEGGEGGRGRRVGG